VTSAVCALTPLALLASLSHAAVNGASAREPSANFSDCLTFDFRLTRYSAFSFRLSTIYIQKRRSSSQTSPQGHAKNKEPSSIQTLLSALELHQICRLHGSRATSSLTITAGSELHRTLKVVCSVIQL
jgi:hypothetical protein